MLFLPKATDKKGGASVTKMNSVVSLPRATVDCLWELVTREFPRRYAIVSCNPCHTSLIWWSHSLKMSKYCWTNTACAVSQSFHSSWWWSTFLIVWHLGWYYVTLSADTLGGSLGSGSFVVKVDISRNGISADEDTYNLETNVQIATAETVFTTSSISGIWVNCS